MKILTVGFVFSWVGACSSEKTSSDQPLPSHQAIPSAKPSTHRLEDGKVQIALQNYVRYQELDKERSGSQEGPCSVGEVDLVGAGTRYNPCALGWVSAGEWIEYEVEDLPEGNYNIVLRVASADPGQEAVVSVNGQKVGTVYAKGGGWASKTNEIVKQVPLKGDINLRVTFPAGNVNVTLIELLDADKDAAVTDVAFHWFEYTGRDALFTPALGVDEYQNPILAGFYPDPSITRVGADYYMVHSSYAWWPGLPIYHSTDLVTWRHLGHALTRTSQINLENRQISEGIFAPAIRHHKGLFYIISTAVWAGGNFILTAEDPAGPWSDPIWLTGIGGIHPELFFDNDGRVYILHNDVPPGIPLYEGHRGIWLWEFDLETRSVIKKSSRMIVNGGVNPETRPVWIEAPRLFKKDGWYYLTCAEGGTGDHHSQVIFRSKTLSGPFIPAERNPILTQRDLDISRDDPITAAGHADIVQTQTGEWWAVFLASRAYNGNMVNIGRETYLLPVQWKDGWPMILEGGQTIPYRHSKPSGLQPTPDAERLTGNFVWRDNFDQPELDAAWNTLRGPGSEWYTLHTETSRINLAPLGSTLLQRTTPAFIGRRQQHIAFVATTEMELNLSNGVSAGIAAFQNESYHYYMGVKNTENGHNVFLERTDSSVPTIFRSQDENALGDRLILGIEGSADAISFFYEDPAGNRTYLGKNLDARILSTQVAGGFLGTYLGIHARRE